MGKAREVELKLEIGPADAARLRAHPLLAGQSGRSVELTSIYYDTEGRTLRKAGYSLRVRQCGDRFAQTVKRQCNGGAGLYDRPEWEQAIAGPGLCRDALAETPAAALLGGGDKAALLVPLVTSRVERGIWNLVHQGAEIELTLDRGTIEGGGRVEPLCEVELELKRGDPAALMALASALAADFPLRIGVMTKAERGFALADRRLGQVAKAEPVRLAEGMSVAEGFAAIAHACLRHFRLNEPLVDGRRDAAALHQARVAMRRLRSALSLFRPVIRDEAFPRLREELGWFTAALGDARNIDVFAKRLGDDPALAPWRERLDAARDAAYARVEEALASHRLRALILDLVAWMELGDWRRGDRARRPLARFAAKRLDRGWKKVGKRGKAIAALDPEARHRLRIDVKKLRYAVEFLAGLQPGHHAAFAAKLEALQEALGELNDIETGHALLDSLSNGRPAPLPPAFAPEAEAARTTALLADAQKAHDALSEIGPFWR